MLEYKFEDNSVSHIHRYITQPILKLLNSGKEKKILDVGCGNGWLDHILLKEGFDVYGIDSSVSGIEWANQEHPGRFFVQNVLSQTLPEPLRTHRFLVIISTEVIEHLYDPRGYVAFCRQILLQAGGGELIISTPYHGYVKNLVLAATGKMDKHFTALWDVGHIKFWSRKTLTQLLEEAGFQVIDFVGCGRLPYLWKSMIVRADIKK
jgi:2-polyprenyl-3-methyl-5-hydroxy-6-metoxy-1,4-benzoquinol methylase